MPQVVVNIKDRVLLYGVYRLKIDTFYYAARTIFKPLCTRRFKTSSTKNINNKNYKT